MIGLIILTITALICSLVLVFSDYHLNEKNNNIQKITELLPGYNCGGCGFGSCEGMANKLLEDENYIDKCRPMKKEEAEKLKEYIKKVLK